MALTDLSQSIRPELGWGAPVHLVEIQLSVDTLRFARFDFPYRYGSSRIDYEGYLLGIDGLGETVGIDQPANSSITLKLINGRWGKYAFLSQLNADQPFSRATVSIYEARLVTDKETFADIDSGRTLLGKWAVEQLRDVDVKAGTFSLVCCSRLFARKNRLGINRVSATTFPLCDRDDLGKYRNIPFGDLEYVPCRCVKTGAVDTLFADIGSGALSTLIVSGVAKIPWDASGTFQIDDEHFNYASYDEATRTFSGVNRARHGTAADSHSKGACVYQVITEIVYEASSLPVDSISDVFVDNVRQSVGSVCKVYTGRSGSQLPGYGESAVVLFTVKPVVKKQVNVEVEAEHAHSTAEGSHGHSFAGAQVVTRAGISSMSGGHVDNPSYAHDGDEGTGARLVVASGDSSGEAILTVTLNNYDDLGDISGILVKVCFSVQIVDSSCGSFEIRYGQYTAASFSGGASLGKGWRSYALTPAAGWGGDLKFIVNSVSTSPVTAFVYDCEVKITCSPRLSNAPASGVSTSRSGTTVIGGQSVADVVVGQEVCVHMKGVRDDAYGSYSGTANSLIKWPDHVFRYILGKLMGLPIGDIGSSFDATGSILANIGYKFAFILHDIGTDAQRVLSTLSAQCRSIFLEWAGRFELRFIPSYAPDSPDFAFDSDDIVSGPVFTHAALADVANHVMALYRKDYRGNKDPGVTQNTGIHEDALAAGYLGYAESGWGPGDLDETMQLNAIRLDAPANDLLEFKVLRKRLPGITVDFTAKWRAILAAPGMIFTLPDPVYGTQSYILTHYELVPGESSGFIKVKGEYLPAWYFYDSISETVSDQVVIIQTHLISIGDSVSDGISDTLDSLCWPRIQTSVTDGYSDDLALVQTHLAQVDDSVSDTVSYNIPLGNAWQRDSGLDIMPAIGTFGSTGWFEDDASADLELKDSLTGSDDFWETDESADLMPI